MITEEMTQKEWLEYRIKSMMAAGQSKKDIAKSLGVSRMTLYRAIKCINLIHRNDSNHSGLEIPE